MTLEELYSIIDTRKKDKPKGDKNKSCKKIFKSKDDSDNLKDEFDDVFDL